MPQAPLTFIPRAQSAHRSLTRLGIQTLVERIPHPCAIVDDARRRTDVSRGLPLLQPSGTLQVQVPIRVVEIHVLEGLLAQDWVHNPSAMSMRSSASNMETDRSLHFSSDVSVRNEASMDAAHSSGLVTAFSTMRTSLPVWCKPSTTGKELQGAGCQFRGHSQRSWSSRIC